MTEDVFLNELHQKLNDVDDLTAIAMDINSLSQE